MRTKQAWYDSDSEARWMGGITKWVFFFFALVLLLGVLGLVFGWFSAPFRGAVDARNKTVGNGSYRIAQYDHFYDLCGQVQAAEDRLDTAQEMLKGSPDSEVFKANVAATKNMRAQLIREYNADSSKAGTAAQFKASDLPYSIDITQEHTQCAR